MLKAHIEAGVITEKQAESDIATACMLANTIAPSLYGERLTVSMTLAAIILINIEAELLCQGKKKDRADTLRSLLSTLADVEPGLTVTKGGRPCLNS